MFKKLFNKKISLSTITSILGLLWLLDGFLQLQPKMFTDSFANNVVSPASLNQPFFVGGLMHFSIHILLMHPAIFNSLFATTQILLGIFILWKRTSRVALICSVFWALFVWFLGEGLGGMLTGNSALLMGVPGAALIYALIGLSILGNYKKPENKKRPAYWLPLVWAIFWLIGAILVFEPSLNSTAKLGAMVNSMGTGAPNFLSSIDRHIGQFIQTKNFWLIVIYAILEVFIAIGVLLPGRVRKITIFGSIPILLLFWVVGQSMGSYYSGVMTDPNSAPLYILLGFSILSCEELSFSEFKKRISTSFLKVEKLIS